jgi:hypothetical protein
MNCFIEAGFERLVLNLDGLFFDVVIVSMIVAVLVEADVEVEVVDSVENRI